MQSPEEWRPVLLKCSQAFLADPEKVDQYPADVRESGWLGYPPATEQAIAEAEARLGTTLPPSLRAFYQVSNGWRDVGPFIWAIPSVEQVDWLETFDPQLYEIVLDVDPRFPWTNEEGLDEHTKEQKVWVLRSLVVSSAGDASTWLLDPGRVNDAGEWAAGRWSSWNPAMEWLTDSFAAMFLEEFTDYLEW